MWNILQFSESLDQCPKGNEMHDQEARELPLKEHDN